MAAYATNIPGAPGYAQAALLAKTAYQQALARLNAQRQGTLRQYGYQADIDPSTGVPQNMRVDPNNSFGQYQEIRRGHADAAEQLEDDLLGSGLRGGLAEQQMTRQRHGFGRDDAQMGMALTGALAGFQDQQTSAKYQMDSALHEAELAAARAAISDENFNPADFSGVDYPEYGADPILDAATNPGTRRPVDGPRTAAGTPGVQWGGRVVGRDQLIRELVAQGVKPSEWARKHPEAAKRLGISPEYQGNNALINKVLGKGSAVKPIVKKTTKKGGK